MKNVTMDRPTTYLLFLLLLYFSLTGLEIAKSVSIIIGLILFGVLILLLYLRLSKDNINHRLYFVILPFVFFQGLYILNYSSYTKSATLGNITYQAFFILLMFILATITWNKVHIKILSQLSLILYPIVLFYILTDSDIVNPNRLGGYAFLLSFFPIIYILNYSKRYVKMKLFLLITFSLTLMWFSGARAVLLAVAFILVTYLIWKTITRSRILFSLYFFIITLFCYGFTVIYPRLNEILPNYAQLEFLMIKYTGESILSGRDEIWKLLADIISMKPWFGYGAGAQPEDLILTTLSAHNLYLQIALQVGIIGLIFFGLFLYFIWNTFLLNRFDKRVMFSASFFVGIIIYQINEVSLTQNNLPFSLLQWTIIGVGLSLALNKQKTPS